MNVEEIVRPSLLPCPTALPYCHSRNSWSALVVSYLHVKYLDSHRSISGESIL